VDGWLGAASLDWWVSIRRPVNTRSQKISATPPAVDYGDYVDANDNVAVPNIDNEMQREPPGPGSTERGADAYFMRIVGGVGMHAGYLPGYPAWLHSDAGIHGGGFFSITSRPAPVTIGP